MKVEDLLLLAGIGGVAYLIGRDRAAKKAASLDVQPTTIARTVDPVTVVEYPNYWDASPLVYWGGPGWGWGGGRRRGYGSHRRYHGHHHGRHR